MKPLLLPSIRAVLLVVAFFWAAASAQALVFNWDANYGNWSAGAPGNGQTDTQNYNNDPNHTGNDVQISIRNANSNGSGFSWINGYPSVGNDVTGGTNQDALQLRVADNNATGIVVTVTFLNYTPGVRDVSFTLWDIDRAAGQFTDQITNITAITTTGAVIGATSVTGSAANAVSGTGIGITVNGTSTATDTTSAGNATINFNGVAIRSFSFTWRNTDPGMGQQFIAMHDITYTPVPEVGSSAVALALCGGVAGYGLLGRTRRSRA